MIDEEASDITKSDHFTMKNQTLNNFKLSKYLVLIMAAALLSSCAVPDPMFSANYRNIQDADYPQNKIVGTWVDFIVDAGSINNNAYEKKFYFDIRPNGRAAVRMAAVNRTVDGYLFTEAPTSWQYLGKNCWKITNPSSNSYRVYESHILRMSPSYVPSEELFLRYYNGSLYVINKKRVMVKATADNISQLAHRVRNLPQY